MTPLQNTQTKHCIRKSAHSHSGSFGLGSTLSVSHVFFSVNQEVGACLDIHPDLYQEDWNRMSLMREKNGFWEFLCLFHSNRIPVDNLWAKLQTYIFYFHKCCSSSESYSSSTERNSRLPLAGKRLASCYCCFLICHMHLITLTLFYCILFGLTN